MVGVERVDPGALRQWIAGVLKRTGVSELQADSIADALSQADSRGIHTHGAEMLPRYVAGFEQGYLNVRAEPHVVGGRGATSRWDGDRGLGHFVCDIVTRHLAGAAREHGVAVAAVRNSNHFGMAARYPMQLADQGLIGFTTTNTPPVMPALDSARAVIGNNPLAWAFPRRGASPIVLDMAISAAARGKVRLAASEGKPIPLGWAVDAAGNPTQDAAEALKGWLLPVGGAKGYGLGVVNELLAAALSGARVLSEISDRTIVVGDLHDDWGVGHFLLAIDPEALLPLEEYHTRTEAIVRLLTSQRRLDGGSVTLPGDPEAHAQTISETSGISLPHYVLEAMDQLAHRFDIPRLSRRNTSRTSRRRNAN